MSNPRKRERHLATGGHRVAMREAAVVASEQG